MASPNAPCALPQAEAPARLAAAPGLRCGGHGGVTQLGPTLETSPEGQARWGPHSPFSRVCRFARTRRKVCREETRTSGRGCEQRAPHPYTRPGPVLPSPGQRTVRGPPPQRGTHLFPAPAAGPPLAALHSRGRAAGPGCGGMRADAARPSGRRRSAPGGRRHVGPGHVTRGARVRVQQAVPMTTDRGRQRPASPTNQRPGRPDSGGAGQSKFGGYGGPCVPDQSEIRD